MTLDWSEIQGAGGMATDAVNIPVDDDEDDGNVSLSKTKLEDAEMDIAPMIDCTFLLLIFFIVCSHIGQSAGVDLPKAKYGVAVSAKYSVILTVAVGEGDMARVYQGDGLDESKVVPGATIAEQEDAIAQYVQDAMANNSDLKNVLIKGARNLKHREVSRVCRAAVRNVELSNLYVAVMETN
ncbi:MAG: ExbD/TolR family protein [Planctomycetota bacterium]